MAPPQRWTGVTLHKVTDGDTFEANLDLGWQVYTIHTIRLRGVDAPPKGSDRGKAAAAAVERLLGDSVFGLTSYEKDKYGRRVCDVTLTDGRSLAEVLLGLGLAVPWDGHGPHPPGGGALT